jgi:NAD(P)-dependent dehydrogenase (short-subunit alcohol dehydrogenase family)
MSRSGSKDIAAETGGTGVAGSVLNDVDVEKAVATVMDAFGRVDVAVFGAGQHSKVIKCYQVPPAPSATASAMILNISAKFSIYPDPFGMMTTK